jgi:hypothetical protein
VTDSTETKRCGICGETKFIADFPLDVSAPSGRRNQCLTCRAARLRAYRATDRGREARRLAMARYRARNRERNLALRAAEAAQSPTAA